MMVKLLSDTFRSVKPHNPKIKLAQSNSSSSPSQLPAQSSQFSSPARPILISEKNSSWSVYLILSTNIPIKTYVGVTTDFSRRLKQHNGELKGGAKSSRAGRPWVSACLINGFKDKSKACEFESKWKITSRKLMRKKENNETAEQVNKAAFYLLRHRLAALDKVKCSIDCNHLDIIWELDPF